MQLVDKILFVLTAYWIMPIYGRYQAGKWGYREVGLFCVLLFSMWGSYYGSTKGWDSSFLYYPLAGVYLSPVAMATFFVLRIIYYRWLVSTWSHVYFIEPNRYCWAWRSRNARRIAPSSSHFTKGRDMIAFRWNKENGTDAMVERYNNLADVSPHLIIRYGRYIKHDVPALNKDIMGPGWKWANRAFFREYSPLNAKPEVAKPKKGRKQAAEEGTAAGSQQIAGAGDYRPPKLMMPATFYETLTTSKLEVAVTPPDDPDTYKNLRYSIIGALGIFVAGTIAVFVFATPNTSTNTPEVPEPTAQEQLQKEQGRAAVP